MNPTVNYFAALAVESEAATLTPEKTKQKKKKKTRAVDKRRILFIGNLTAEPYAWEEMLRKAATCGWIESSELVNDLRYARAFGIIKMRTHQEAAQLLQWVGTKKTETFVDSHGIQLIRERVYAEWARRQ